jgi:hypothetical protein
MVESGWFLWLREALIKSHRGRCGKNGPRARRLGTSIPAAGCRNGCEATAGQAKCQANTVGPRATPRSQRLCGLWLGSPQPSGLKPFVDFCLAVSRRSRPPDCFAGYDAAPAARRCGVARSGETSAGIAQHSRLQKSANALQRPSWDLISASLGRCCHRSGSNKKTGASALRSYGFSMGAAACAAAISSSFWISFRGVRRPSRPSRSDP